MIARNKKAASAVNEYTRVWYGYSRVSDEKQVASGLSLEAQRKSLMNDFESLNNQRDLNNLPPYLKCEGDGIFVDRAVSAHKLGFVRRDAGGALNARLKAGDCVSICKLDRGFRNLLSVVYDNWFARGVDLRLMDLNLDLTTAIGRMLIQQLAIIGEFESAMRSERVHAANAVRREKELALCQVTPLGKKRVGKKWLDDPVQIAAIAYAIHLRDSGLSDRDIALRFRCERIYHEGKEWTKFGVSEAVKRHRGKIEPTPTMVWPDGKLPDMKKKRRK